MWWITGSPGAHFDPTAVGTISGAIKGFVEEQPAASLVVLDGVEYITIHIGFAKTLLFIERVNEDLMPQRATLLILVDPACFDPKEFARLDHFTGGIAEGELHDAIESLELGHDFGA